MREQIKLTDNSWFIFAEKFIEASEADKLLERLLSLPWEQKKVVIRGKEYNQPRLVAWAGQLPYRYSNLTLEPRPWVADLLALRLRLKLATPHEFNHVLLNLYRNGDDTIGFHADNEPELGDAPTIASLSLGQNRQFLIRPRKKGEKDSFLTLTHGSLLVMGGEFQREFTHSVPREKNVSKQRVNLTFRKLLRAP